MNLDGLECQLWGLGVSLCCNQSVVDLRSGDGLVRSGACSNLAVDLNSAALAPFTACKFCRTFTVL